MKPENRSALVQHMRLWIRKHGIPSSATFIIGVSAGVDSMVLAETCHRAGLNVEIAHVNYGLRGEESDLDEVLVKAWCEMKGVPFHLHRPNFIAGDDGIQSSARRERFAFFERIRSEIATTTGNLVLIATAHHADDQAETILLQLIRAADPLALAGIVEWDAKRCIARPFLSFSKEDLTHHAIEWELEHRNDASNEKTDYLRNRIRLQGLPLLESIREGSSVHLAHWAKRFQPLAAFIQLELDTAKDRCWTEEPNEGILNLALWQKEPLKMELLHRLALKHGISAKAVSSIEALTLEGVESGAKFSTNQAEIVRIRGELRWVTLT
ncbi:MAG: tRNA lysidine(34) synthetase TilS [Flavobacteriales bacterium]